VQQAARNDDEAERRRIAATAQAWATPGAIVPTDASGPEWEDLFDWNAPNVLTDRGEGRWSVQDDLLVAELPIRQRGEPGGPGAPGGRGGRSGRGGPTALESRKPFADAEFRFVVRTSGGPSNRLIVREGNESLTSHARLHLTSERSSRSNLPLGSIWTHMAAEAFSPSEEQLAQVDVARATNGEPSGWDVVSVRTVGKEVASAVNGVVLAVGRLPDLAPEGLVRLEVRNHQATPVRSEFRSIQVRSLDADGAPARHVESPGASRAASTPAASTGTP